MSVTRGIAGVLAVLGAVVVVATSAAAPDRRTRPPRIVSAAMLDADRDARADGVRLTYSVRIRHAVDRDRRYPFAVAGYRIRSVGAASGKTLVVLLVEKAQPDPAARPAIRYRWTSSKPVTDRAGRQAAAQIFRGSRAHGRTPQPIAATTTTITTTTTTTSPTVVDADGDGYPDAKDCAPRDAKVHPGAADLPDLAFVDSNCDGIDGTEEDAIFASPKGDDANPGTKEKPKRQIQAAVAAAAGKDRYVLAATGLYTHLTAASGVDVYGGFDPDDWARKSNQIASILGAPEGLFADGAKDVTLQLLTIRGVNGGAGAYGIRAINNSSLRLERVNVSAGDGANGAPGAAGKQGLPGQPGKQGDKGACDSFVRAIGGAGGESPVGRDGGKGGNAYYEIDGQAGAPGIVGTPGGKGGSGGQPAESGHPGQNGSAGSPGARGAGGDNSTAPASTTWQGRGGIDGIYGGPGNGGGGGGGGGGQDGFFVTNGSGNAGSGGGGGGAGGRGGEGGSAGGGSFGVYLHRSAIVAEASSIAAGDGGAGGRGGNGGPGGLGGAGGPWQLYCGGEIGHGGAGGRGGNGGEGGAGGGGAGGPSIGVMKIASSSAVLTGAAVVVGSAGAGGAPGTGGTGAPAPSQVGIVQAIYP